MACKIWCKTQLYSQKPYRILGGCFFASLPITDQAQSTGACATQWFTRGIKQTCKSMSSSIVEGTGVIKATKVNWGHY